MSKIITTAAIDIRVKQAGFKIGQIVNYTSMGKVARAEGKAGSVVSGRVLNVDEIARKLIVMPSHRMKEGAPNFNMASQIDFDSVILDKIKTTKKELAANLMKVIAADKEKETDMSAIELTSKIDTAILKMVAKANGLDKVSKYATILGKDELMPMHKGLIVKALKDAGVTTYTPKGKTAMSVIAKTEAEPATTGSRGRKTVGKVEAKPVVTTGRGRKTVTVKVAEVKPARGRRIDAKKVTKPVAKVAPKAEVAKRMTSARMVSMFRKGEKVPMSRENFDMVIKALARAKDKARGE